MQAILSSRRSAVAAVLLAALAAIVLGVAPAPFAQGRGEPEPGHHGGPRIEIEDFAFHPRPLRVQRGARVVFVNRDGITHTATRAGSFDTGRIRPGQRAAVRFRKRGVYVFHCRIHPFMHGKIVVR